ncbi:unnamed protein product [Auanema sp. JU1783]|nr:unnamed protein product [Auanema sp. JU1783]
MSCETEVLTIGSKLDKIIGGSKPADDAVELLDALGRLPITLEVLTSTQIGKKLNEFRKKTADEKLAKLAKNLIKEWKNLIDKKELNEKMPRNDSTSSNLSAKGKEIAKEKDTKKPEKPPVPVPSSSSGTFPPKHLLSDDVRNKSAQMILNALRYTDLPDGTLDPESLAVDIEQSLYDVHKGTNDKYKAGLRSRVFNLRDKKNTALRENVLTGVIKPKKLAIMTSEEMASDEIRQQREKFNHEAINEYQMATQQGTPSDMFKCGKCKKNNCTYTQLQTRSSDEPMTTFVFCLECGNRWKFC